jgi:hypothetical protein
MFRFSAVFRVPSSLALASSRLHLVGAGATVALGSSANAHMNQLRAFSSTGVTRAPEAEDDEAWDISDDDLWFLDELAGEFGADLLNFIPPEDQALLEKELQNSTPPPKK